MTVASKSARLSEAPQKLNAGVNWLSLNLNPAEGYLFSLIDGQLKALELCQLTGLSEDTVVESLDRLSEVGLVSWRTPAKDEAFIVQEAAPLAPAAHVQETTPLVQETVPPDSDSEQRDSLDGDEDIDEEEYQRRRAAIGALALSNQQLWHHKSQLSLDDKELLLQQEDGETGDPFGLTLRPWDEGEQSILNEESILSGEQREKVLLLRRKLRKVTHYRLLGVSEDADRKEIKSAYFTLVGDLHPDRFFGKNLGKYKSRLEQLFQALTEAHDVLSRKKTRLDYDEYLAVQRSLSPGFDLPNDQELDIAYGETLPPPSFSSHPSSAGSQPAQGDSRQELLDKLSRGLRSPKLPSDLQASYQSRASSGTFKAVDPEISYTSSIPPSSTERRGSSAPPAGPSSIPIAVPALDPESRRRVLAQKLRGGLNSSGSPPAAPPAQNSYVEQHLREHLDKMRQQVPNRFAHFQQLAEESLAQANPVGALTAIKMAQSALSGPAGASKAPLPSALVALEQRAYAELKVHLLKQAEYEEKHSMWAEAALTLGRALKAGNDPAVCERAARATLNAERDPRMAAKYCRDGLSADPNHLPLRLLMVRAYIMGDKLESAAGELERLHERCQAMPEYQQLTRILKDRKDR